MTHKRRLSRCAIEQHPSLPSPLPCSLALLLPNAPLPTLFSHPPVSHSRQATSALARAGESEEQRSNLLVTLTEASENAAIAKELLVRTIAKCTNPLGTVGQPPKYELVCSVDLACTGCGIVACCNFHGPLTLAQIRAVAPTFSPQCDRTPACQGQWNAGGHLLALRSADQPCPHRDVDKLTAQVELMGYRSMFKATVTQHQLKVTFARGALFSSKKLKVIGEPRWGPSFETLPKGATLASFVRPATGQ
jgi:hypothetical protein